MSMTSTSPASPSRFAVMAAFAAIYLIWGSTYLAIRFGVETLPPLLMAGTRFVLAGVMLYLWVRSRGTPRPSREHWRYAAVVGCLLVGANAGVTWAEQTVPSGIAALLVTTVPLWMVVLHGVWHRARPATGVVVGLVLGFTGVIVLVGSGNWSGGASIDRVGAMVLLLAALSWATGSVYSQRAKLPSSLGLSSAMQMIAGGAVCLAIGTMMGEWGRLDVSLVTGASLLAVLYLILFGSLVGFSAYVWLLRVSTPARVSTYAFVNPVVAVFLGYAFANEPLTARTLIAAALVITAVVLITFCRKPVRAIREETAPTVTVTDQPNEDGESVDCASSVHEDEFADSAC